VKDYIVKSGSMNDLKGIVELDKAIFGLSRTPEDVQDKLRLRKDVHITITTIADGKLVGYGIGYEEKSKYYLWSLAVLPEYRRKGIGSDIIEEQITFAKERGYSNFFVKSSSRWREMLRLLLKKEFNIIGFKEHEWEEGPSGSAIWLEKIIL